MSSSILRRSLQLSVAVFAAAAFTAPAAHGVLSARSWTAMLPAGVAVPAVGGIVSRTHITALRAALDEALEVFALPLAPYTDLLDRPTMIEAIHLQQLKERTQ